MTKVDGNRCFPMFEYLGGDHSSSTSPSAWLACFVSSLKGLMWIETRNGYSSSVNIWMHQKNFLSDWAFSQMILLLCKIIVDAIIQEKKKNYIWPWTWLSIFKSTATYVMFKKNKSCAKVGIFEGGVECGIPHALPSIEWFVR